MKIHWPGLLLIAVVAPESALPATLHIRVLEENGHAMWARIEVRGANDKEYQPAASLRDLTAGHHRALPYYLGSFVVQGECAMEVPPGRYRVIGEHGLEYTREEVSVEVGAEGSAQVTLLLRPWIRMWKQGWWSGDLHIHRPLADTQELVLAEDLNFAPAITQWPHRKDRQDVGEDVWGTNAASIMKIDDRHFMTLHNAEDERGGGAFLFLSLHSLLEGRDTAGFWNPSTIDFIQQARAQGGTSNSLPWIDCENTQWWEVPVAMALAAPDSIEVLGNHFMQYGVDDVTDWGRPPGKHVENDRRSWLDYSLGLYFHYLNLGFHIPPSAGSASGVHPNPVGYNRVYAQIDGPFTVEKWFAALRSGKSFITDGPMLFFKVKPDAENWRASVEVHSREPLDRIELVANGEVIQWAPVPPDTRDYTAQFTFDATLYTWVAARCFLRTGDTIRLAHSSPAFLPGHHDCRPDAKYFVDWMNDLIAETDKRTLPDEKDRRHLLDLYGQALAFYHQKFEQACATNLN